MLDQSAQQHHGRLCPRQVLGARMGMYAGELLGLNLPQPANRLYTFVEMDGCFMDGITAASGCACGHRTMRLFDYGKIAATFVDTISHDAIRIRPNPTARIRASEYAPNAPDRWHAQLDAYQRMPATELLLAQPVALTVSLKDMISRPGVRVVCECCGEDVINEREVRASSQILCQACARGTYYTAVHHEIYESILLASALVCKPQFRSIHETLITTME